MLANKSTFCVQLFEFVRWCEGELGSRSGERQEGDAVEGCAQVGSQLHSAYTHFLQHFLPHMKQEEQEFQVSISYYTIAYGYIVNNKGED